MPDVADLETEIARLNDELTCGSEAYHSILAENERMRASLDVARWAFESLGMTALAVAMTGELQSDGNPSLPAAVDKVPNAETRAALEEAREIRARRH